MDENTNKFGVPYKEYWLNLADGSKFNIDIGIEEDWGNVQRCVTDWDGKEHKECVGWGCDGKWSEVTGVLDHESGTIYGTREKVLEWAEKCVWCYVDKYSE